jgi:hypothetical protein
LENSFIFILNMENNMGTNRNINLIVYKTHWEIFKTLPDDKLKELMIQINNYVDGKEVVFEDLLLKTIWITLKFDWDKQVQKYENKVIANRENGKLGGRPKTEKTQMDIEETQKTQMVILETQPNPNNLKDKDKDREKAKDKAKAKAGNTIPRENVKPGSFAEALEVGMSFDEFMKL